MEEQFTPYKPKYLAEDMILSVELRERGSKFAFKRLAKEKKGMYKTGTPDECSYWWDQSKKGKKKDKKAMVIMASQYDFVAKQLDRTEGTVLDLVAKTKSQEEEIKLLKLKLQQWDKEKSKVLQLEFKTESQEDEILLLKLKLQQWDKEKSKVLQLEFKTESQEEEIKLLKLKLQQWDKEKSKVLQLEFETKSQEDEILLLQQKLLQWKEEYKQLNCEVSHFKSEIHSQKKEITSLKRRVQEQEEENGQLKENCNTSLDDTKNALKLPVTYRASGQKSHLSLLNELPDLQYNDSNYKFWVKIKSWLLRGELDPQGVFKLVRIKCPQKAWRKIVENVNNKDLTETAFSIPGTTMRQKLEKLWKCVSEALGPGTNSFQRYYYQRQKDGETFQEYFQEKFRLYCSYGVDNTEPDKNDRHFLCNVIEKAAKRYQALASLCPKSHTDLLNSAMMIDHMLTTAEWNNECLNCGREGHTKAECRRPGGDAEVGSNECYTCGAYGHWARDCWTYHY